MSTLTPSQDAIANYWYTYNWVEATPTGSVNRSYTSTIGLLLGYPYPPNLLPDDQLTASQHPHLFDICLTISKYKNLLDAAMLDAMAVKVGDLELDYGTYLNNLKMMGSSNIAMLSQFTGIPLKMDMFTGRVSNTISSPFSIQSLY